MSWDSVKVGVNAIAGKMRNALFFQTFLPAPAANIITLGDFTVQTTPTQLLTAPTECLGVQLRAHPDNTDVVRVGESSAIGAARGALLQASEPLAWPCSDVSNVYLWSATPGQIVCAYYYALA